MSTKDYIEKDYYAALGVAKDADAADIKKAYRKLARDLPPGQEPGQRRGRGAVQGGLRGLRRAVRRAKRQGVRRGARAVRRRARRRAAAASAAPGRPGGDDVRPRRPVRRTGRRRRRCRWRARRPLRRPLRPRRRRRAAADVGRAAAAGRRDRGRRSPSTRPSPASPCRCGCRATAPCPTCHGTGAKAGTAPRVCPVCEGAGQTSRKPGGVRVLRAVPRVPRPRPSSTTRARPATAAGRALPTRTVQARIPAGVKDGQRIRLRGKGAPGRERRPERATCSSWSTSRAHPLFGRKGDNLTLTVPVTFAEAALGRRDHGADARRWHRSR